MQLRGTPAPAAIAAMAAGAGVPRSCTVRTLDDFEAAFVDALQAGALTTIVAKVDAVGPSGYVTELAMLENRFEFQRWLRQH